MPVADSRVKFTCPACAEAFRLGPVEARNLAAALLETAEACEEELAAEMRRRLDEGMKP